jgi:hypothetical protein
MNAQNRWIKFTGALVALTLACAVQALTLHRDGDDLYATGTIQVGDDLVLRAAHGEAPVRRLVMVNSPGGAFLTSLRIARWVEELRITTVAAGHCLSACSLVFMAGEQRQFAQTLSGQTHLIGIHGPYAQRTGQPSAPAAVMMLSYYRNRMGEKFDAALMERAIYQMQDPTGLLVVPQAGGAEGGSQPWHCPSNRTRRDLCTHFPNKDGLSLGLLTTDEPGTVRIPQVFGRLAERSPVEWPTQGLGAVAAQGDTRSFD